MLPIQITLRDIPSSEAVEASIRKRSEKLDRFHDKITSCRVVVELSQKHKHQGKLFNIRVDINVPGKELVVTRKSDEDIYVAIRDAFDAIVRQLEEHSSKQHGHVKTHTDVMHGHVARLMSNDGYGFIEGIDGNEYYFSVTNVSHPHFEKLVVGDAVEYFPETASDGRHAQHIVKGRNNHNNHVE